MSRMSMARAIERPPESRVDHAVVLGLSDAVQGLTGAVQRVQQEHDTRYHALEAHLNSAVQDMDALVTGLHQDSANVIIRYQAMMQWLAQRFPEFERETQGLLDALVAQAEATAEHVVTDAKDHAGADTPPQNDREETP